MLQQFAHVPSTEPYRHAMTTGSTQVRAYSTSSKGRRPDHVSAGDSSQRSLVPNTSYDSTALNNQDILKVSRHMVEKHSTNVQRDEICLKYLQHKCLYGPQCHRIHPRNPGIYVTALLLNSTHTPRDLPTRSQTDQSPAAHKALGISSHTNAPRRSVSPSPTTFGVSGDSSGAEDDWYSRPSWECHTEHEAWFRDPGASSTSESDLSTGAAIETGPSQTGNSPNLGRVHRKPPPDEMCWEWLRNRCARGYACKYRHGDLEYDDSPVAIPSPQARPELRPSEPVDVTLHEYTKLKLADGFEILDLVTGFDTQWITINNLPAKITQSQVLELVKPYGTVLSVKFPPRSTQSRVLVKLCMGNAAEAQQAYSALNGKNAFKSRLTVSLPVTDYSNRNGYVDSTIVRVDWQAPCKVAYAGYASLEEAQTAISAIDRCPMGDIYVRAYIHHGLPQLGFATTRLEHVPADANVQQLKEFTSSLDAAWERPQNDVPATRAIDGIRRNLAQAGKLVSFEPEPPPYKGGTVRAWARYETSAQALKAVDSMNGRKPGFTKLTRIYVTHMHGIAYPLTSENYAKAKDDIEQWHTFISERRWRTSSVSISNTSKDTVNVKLYNVTRQGLCHMKGVFEEILFGEVIRDKGRPVWDIYFEHPSGLEFLKQLEQRYSGTAITRDLSRRTLKVHGPSQHRGAVRSVVIRHLASLNSQTVRRISIQDNVMRGLIIRSGLKDLQNEFGTDAINVDLWNRAIVVRGKDNVFNAVKKCIVQMQQIQHSNDNSAQNCPVCLSRPSPPLCLPCGHVWCRSCFTAYLTSSRYFPFTCLGDNAKCTARIPPSIAREELSPEQFDSLVEASLSAHLAIHRNEFNYCLTPGCQQIYRTGPPNTVRQCPSCLLRLCSYCHVEYHDGFDCKDRDGGEALLQDWIDSHDVKRCPGCNVVIEKIEGCHHMTCIQCKTHICWVCLATFPGGDGIYDHMRKTHGGIGIPLIEV